MQMSFRLTDDANNDITLTEDDIEFIEACFFGPLALHDNGEE